MSGHSHWSGIKYKKGIADAKRGKVFTKLGKAITIAARQGGGNCDTNFSLRHAIEKAKESNMPKDNIAKAIKRGTGELEGVTIEELTYEGYGPAGVAIIVEVVTDKRTRTTPEIRKIFENHNSSTGASGCVSWMFKRKGLFHIALDQTDEEALMDITLDAGADDIATEADYFEVTCPMQSYEAVSKAITAAGIKAQLSELTYIADTDVEVDAKNAAKVLSMIESLDDHDDVQNVHANMDISEDVFNELQELQQ